VAVNVICSSQTVGQCSSSRYSLRVRDHDNIMLNWAFLYSVLMHIANAERILSFNYIFDWFLTTNEKYCELMLIQKKRGNCDE